MQALLAILTLRLATTLLSPAEMGRMFIILSVTAFFALVMISPVGMFINRRIHSWEISRRIKHYFRLYWLYLVFVSLAAVLSLAVIKHTAGMGISITMKWLILLVCGSLILNTMNQTYISLLNLLGFRGWFVGLTLATLSLSLLASLCMVFIFQVNAEYWLLGILTGQAIFMIVSKFIFEQKTPADNPGSNSLNMLVRSQFPVLFAFAWPIAVSIGLNWMQTQSYRFFIKNYLGLPQLGLFVAGYGISAGIIAAFESVLTTYFLPDFYKQISGNDRAKQSAAWRTYVAAIFPALTVTIFFIMAMKSELAKVLLGPDFQSASQFMVWGALAEGARVVTGAYSLAAHARMKTKLLLLPNFIGAVISVVCTWQLLPLIGAMGAGAALTFAGIGTVASIHFLVRPHLAIKLPFYNLCLAAAAGVLLVILMHGGHSFIHNSIDLGWAISSLGIIGTVYLAIQFFLLRPFLSLSGRGT